VSNSASLCHPIQVQNAKLSLYGFTATQTCSAADAKLFGAPLAGSLTDSRHTIESTLSGTYPSTLIVTIIVVIISAAATFYTQRLVKAGNPTQPEGTAATMQKLMAVGIPISVVISGLFFPLGVLIYWFTSNAWTMGQQLYINKFHPHLPPPDPAAGTGGEDPINPNGGHPTTPDRTTEPRAPRPGQRPARPPRTRAPAQRKAKTRRSDKQAVIHRWWRCQDAAGQPIASPDVSYGPCTEDLVEPTATRSGATEQSICAKFAAHDPRSERGPLCVIPEGAGPVKSGCGCCVGRCLAVVRDGLGAPR
jgi:60Kd inner membrane protein